MSGLRRRELERRLDRQRLAEFVAALSLSARGAMNECQVLVGACQLLVGEPFPDGALKALGRCVVVARLVLLQGELERRRPTLQRSEDGPPYRMTGFGRRELERGIG